MEWVLQVVDELDDACSAVRHWTLSMIDEMGVLLIAGGCLLLALVGLDWGANPTIIGACALTGNLAALLKIRGSRAADARTPIL